MLRSNYNFIIIIYYNLRGQKKERRELFALKRGGLAKKFEMSRASLLETKNIAIAEKYIVPRKLRLKEEFPVLKLLTFQTFVARKTSTSVKSAAASQKIRDTEKRFAQRYDLIREIAEQSNPSNGTTAA